MSTRSLVVIAGLAVLAVACGPAVRPSAQAQQLPPDARLIDRETSATFVAAERYRGQVVVLDFWAGWCSECKRTVPQIQRLAAAFARDGLVVVGVNAGEKPTDVGTYASELGIDYPIALDPDLELSDRLGASALPMLVVVDRSGAIVHRAKHVDGPTLDVIRRLLRSPSATP